MSISISYLDVNSCGHGSTVRLYQGWSSRVGVIHLLLVPVSTRDSSLDSFPPWRHCRPPPPHPCSAGEDPRPTPSWFPTFSLCPESRLSLIWSPPAAAPQLPFPSSTRCFILRKRCAMCCVRLDQALASMFGLWNRCAVCVRLGAGQGRWVREYCFTVLVC